METSVSTVINDIILTAIESLVDNQLSVFSHFFYLVLQPESSANYVLA